jgi:glycosyltransferase involved in cell wall biosynthesis
MEKAKLNQPIISVLMPVYNAELYLEEAIKSIINQTFENFEFIIIDDGSTDDSLKIIQKYEDKDSRIICISRENKGIIYSLNEGLNISSGQYIARMDADDISYPDRLEAQYLFMLENKLDVCGGDYISINKDGLLIDAHDVSKNDYEILLTMASNVPFAHPSVMMHKSFLINNKLIYGVYGYKNAEDLDLWINMYDAGAKFGNLDSRILKYRMLTDSLSRSNHMPIKKEVNNQFKLFVYNNKDNFKLALELFCNKRNNTNNIERVAIKALLRYLSTDFDLTLLYRCWRKVSMYNFLFALASYISSKLVIK